MKYLIRDVGLKKLLGLKIDIWEALTEQQRFYERRQNHWDNEKVWSKRLTVKVLVIRKKGANRRHSTWSSLGS